MNNNNTNNEIPLLIKQYVNETVRDSFDVFIKAQKRRTLTIIVSLIGVAVIIATTNLKLISEVAIMTDKTLILNNRISENTDKINVLNSSLFRFDQKKKDIDDLYLLIKKVYLYEISEKNEEINRLREMISYMSIKYNIDTISAFKSYKKDEKTR